MKSARFWVAGALAVSLLGSTSVIAQSRNDSYGHYNPGCSPRPSDLYCFKDRVGYPTTWHPCKKERDDESRRACNRPSYSDAAYRRRPSNYAEPRRSYDTLSDSGYWPGRKPACDPEPPRRHAPAVCREPYERRQPVYDRDPLPVYHPAPRRPRRPVYKVVTYYPCKPVTVIVARCPSRPVRYHYPVSRRDKGLDCDCESTSYRAANHRAPARSQSRWSSGSSRYPDSSYGSYKASGVYAQPYRRPASRDSFGYPQPYSRSASKDSFSYPQPYGRASGRSSSVYSKPYSRSASKISPVSPQTFNRPSVRRTSSAAGRSTPQLVYTRRLHGASNAPSAAGRASQPQGYSNGVIRRPRNQPLPLAQPGQ